MKKYCIGIDFGTLSARALIADVQNGEILGYKQSFEYPHGIMSALNGRKLPDCYALQHPQDYIDAIETLIPSLMSNNALNPDEIVGIGISFTACTMLPLKDKMTPLCFDPQFADDPQAYVKLWKHAGADKYAKTIENVAANYGNILKITGGTLSGEFMIPKLYETYSDSPQVYEHTKRFINAGDFVASLLCGRLVHSMSYAAIKEHYDNTFGNGYPPREFFSEIDKGFSDVIDKLGEDIDEVGSPCGSITPEWAKKLGLNENVMIAVPVIDAHGAFGAAGIYDGSTVVCLGTSAVVATLSSEKKFINGIHSHGYGATAPGLMTFEAGIRAMGDLYAWFVENCVPAEYEHNASEQGMNIHMYLRSLAETKSVGESGLIALDWWNGNRSVVPNDKLSGMILGLRLSTRPEDIYRAIIESTVFELRRVIENYRQNGIKISKIVATGGIANKDPMLMQILADVLNSEVGCLGSSEATALGSAVWGAVAAGCYRTLTEASEHMKLPVSTTYIPIHDNVVAYERLYLRYVELYDYFARKNDIMEFLYDNKQPV